jgi:hypothetical protein
MTDRLIRPRAWVAALAFFGFLGGAAALSLLPDPFAGGVDDPRRIKVLLTFWVLAGALMAASGFRLLAWRSFKIDDHAIEQRSIWGRRRHAWAELERAERKTRVLEMTFKSGVVRVLANHYKSTDIAAIEALAKLVTKKTL